MMQVNEGLDIIRRDWSELAKELGNFCLDKILSGGYDMFYLFDPINIITFSQSDYLDARFVHLSSNY